MAVSAGKPEAASDEAAPKASGKKGLIKLIVIVLVVGGAIGGGAWWYLGHKNAEGAAEAKQEPAKPPVFYPLETFTVNLVLIETPQFLQTGITLKVSDNAVVEELKLLTPVVRDRILMLMSSRKSTDLLTIEGKRQLGNDIVDAMNEVLGKSEAPAKAVAKKADAKAADAKAAEDEEEKDPEEAKDAKDAKDTKGGAAPKDNSKRAVQAVLFTTFIIQ